MKRIVWIAVAVLMFLPVLQARASRVGNGGALLDGVFRRQAYQLISDIENHPAADALCPALVMKAALDAAEIRVVDELIDKETGLAPLESNREAWSIPGDIQLLKVPWERYLANQIAINEGVKIFILHEVYRTTGSCDDSSGLISQKIPDLLKLPTRNSLIYRFEWVGQLVIGDEEDGLWMDRDWLMDPHAVSDYRFSLVACDTKLDFTTVTRKFIKPPNSEATCVGIEQTGVLVVFRFTGMRMFSRTSGVAWPWSIQVESRKLLADEMTKIENSLRHTSQARPLFVVYDLDEGGLAYGFGLSRLHQIQ